MLSDTKLSDTEVNALNVAVALATGWKQVVKEFRAPDCETVWELPGGSWFFELPDFCRDILALGWMVEWADKQEGVRLSTRRVNAALWGCTIRHGGIRVIEVGQSRSEVAARAIVDYACQKSEASQQSEASAEGQKEGAG